MPIFSNKFSPKKTPIRKAEKSLLGRQSGGNDEVDPKTSIGQINLKLGDQAIKFHDGHWVAENADDIMHREENQKLQNTIKQLEQKNNTLKVKVDILLDMLAECTAERQLQQRGLRKII